MASNVGQGPPAGENNEPSLMPGAVPGQPQDEGGFRSNLQTMRESIDVVGKLNAAMSGFSSKLRGDGKRKLDEFTAGIRTLNKELEETVRLLEESGQGTSGLGGSNDGGGLLVPSGGGSYTQRQLPKSSSADDGGSAGDDGPPAPPPQGDGDRQGGGGQRWSRAATGLGLAVTGGFMAANWFERQREPAAMADMQFTRLSMGSSQTPQDLNAAMLRSFDNNRYTGHQEFFGTQAALEQRGVVAGGQDFNRFMREAGAMRDFIPHQSTEAIAGAAATLAHGQAGHSLRMRGIIDRNASTEEQFRQILTAASAHDRLPTGAELRAANPGTAMYAVLMNFTGGDAELVRMIIDWGIAEDASKRRTGEEISLTDEHAAAMGLDTTVEAETRSQQAAASANVANRQDALAEALITQANVAEGVTQEFRSLQEALPGVTDKLVTAAGMANQATSHFSGAIQQIPSLLFAFLAGGGGDKLASGFSKAGSAVSRVFGRGGVGPSGPSTGAPAARGLSGGGLLGKTLAPIGLYFAGKDFAQSYRESTDALLGEEAQSQQDLGWWDQARGRLGFGPGARLHEELFMPPKEVERRIQERMRTEPAGGLPQGWVEGADHDGPGYSEKGFGGVKEHVARAGHFIDEMFGPFPGGIGGVGSRQGKSDHPRGLALDFMTNKNTRLGDRVVNFLSRNAKHFGVKYLIWKQRINSGDGRGWRRMEDRGSITANHFDHPHVSFEDTPSTGTGGFEPFIESDDTAGEDVDRSVSNDTGLTADVNVSPSGYYSREEVDAIQSALSGSLGGSTSPGGSSSEVDGSDSYANAESGVPVSGDLDTFMAAIRRLESGSFAGNYETRGPVVDTGQYAGERALGAYQIMPGNWDAWAREAGIPGADWRDPRAQDRIARHKFSQYYNQYKSWDATAVAWFAGPSRAERFLEGENLGGISDAVGTSVPTYVSKIREYMGQLSQTAEPAGGADSMPMSEGQPSGGMASMSVGAAMPSLSASQTRQVNVNMNIRIERASREEAERLAEMVKGLVEDEAGIHMVGSR